MIAVFRVLLPFDIYVPLDVDLKIIALKNEADGSIINILPPYASKLKPVDVSFNLNKPAFNLFEWLVKDNEAKASGNVKIDGVPAIAANCLQVNFQKENFDRTAGDPKGLKPITDPPIETIFELVNGMIEAFRAIGKANFLRPVSYDNTYWVLHYFKDDLSQLEEEKGLARSKLGASLRWQVFGIGEELWTDVSSRLIDIQLPTWERLYLDASSLFPEIGPCIVLCFSAIETLTSITLDFLSKGKLPAELWEWITERKPYFHRPNTEQMIDVILKALTGTSLKDEPTLWDGFQQLNRARNNFAHRGNLSIDGKSIDVYKAAELLARTAGILAWLEAKLPEKMRRYTPKYNMKLEFFRMLQAPSI